MSPDVKSTDEMMEAIDKYLLDLDEYDENDLATSSSGSSVKRPGDRIFVIATGMRLFNAGDGKGLRGRCR